MKLFIIFASSLFLCLSANAQTLSSFEGMSTEEVRNFLLSQESSDLAREYALKHQKTRKIALGFLIASGVLAGAAYLYQATVTPNEESLGAGLGQLYKLYLIIGASGLALATSAVLQVVSRNQFYKAKNTYLQAYTSHYSNSLMVGISFSF